MPHHGFTSVTGGGMIVGRGGGAIKGNQHILAPDRAPVTNLMLTVLERAGVPEEMIIENQGDSTGLIEAV